MRRALLAALVGLLAACGVVRGEDAPPDVGAEVDRLLSSLASDDYEVREAARKRLSTLARVAADRLKARRDDPDPEIRRAVEALLASIGEPDAPEAPEGRLGSLGLVTFAAEGTLEDVLARFARDVGGTVRVTPAMAPTPVKAAFERVPYFDAVAALLSPAQAELADGFDEAGQALASARAGSPALPTACAGPFRVEVESVTTVRSLRPQVRPRWTLGLRLFWAPSAQVVTFQSPTVVRAVDPAGRPLRGVESGTTTYGVGGGRRLASTQLTLDAGESEEAAVLAELELRLRARLRHGLQAAEFPALAPDALPVSQTVPVADGRAVKVTVESASEDPDRPGWAAVALTLVLPSGVPAESVQAVLLLPDGGTRPLIDLSSRVSAADGTLKLTLRAPGTPGGGAGRTLRVAWATREEEIPVSFVLRGVPLR